MLRRRKGERGATFVEFALAGVPLLLVIISLVEICLTMWTYETLAFAVREGARYAATKGQGCSYAGNTCGITVANVAHQIATAGTGLAPGTLNITLTSAGGSITCNPLSSCYSNNTPFPPSSVNVESTLADAITVAGYYPETVVFMQVTGIVNVSSQTLRASSQQLIQF